MEQAKTWMKWLTVWMAALFGVMPAMAETETVDGVEWTYTVSGGEAAVAGCNPAIGDVVIPSTLGECPVTSIQAKAFWGREEMTSVSIPASVELIWAGAFAGCGSLERIEVAPDNPEFALEDGVLYSKAKDELISCPRKTSGSFVVPPGVTNIIPYAFGYCSELTSVDIGRGVEGIADCAFYGCAGLESASLENGVKSIGARAFAWCTNLTEVAIPASVTEIGPGAFSGCGKLEGISVSEGNESYASEDGVLFDKEKEEVWGCPGGKAGVYVLPDSVRVIHEGAFAMCGRLSAVTLGNGVESLGNYAFEGCAGLTELAIPDTVASVGTEAFGGCSGLVTLSVPKAWEETEMLANAGVPETCVVVYREADPHDEVTEWYVDASVAVSGDGKSQATAFKTLEEGLAAAAGLVWDPEEEWWYHPGEGDEGEEGDGEKEPGTVWVAPGTYDGDIDEEVLDEFNGAVRGMGRAETTVIQGLTERSEFKFTVLSDLTILNGRGTLGKTSGKVDGVIERCIVKGCLSEGEDCPVARVREIRDSLFAGNECAGTFTTLVYAGLVANSTFADNQAPLGLMDGYMDEGADEWVTCMALNCILWNNIASDYGDLGNYVDDGLGYWDDAADEWVSQGNNLSNCCVNANSMCGWDESGEEYGAGRPDEREGLSVIFDDPLFVDAAHGDYRLAEGSPCIDAGAPAWVVAGEKDVDGNGRVSGTAPDIGCYEAVEEASKEETETTPVAVPHSWLDDKAPGILAANGGDYEAAANAVASNGVNKVWQCYLAGLLPETDEVFIATYTWKDGEMVVTPKPDLGKERVYTVEAVEELDDENVWEERTARSRFFRIKVEMPVAGGAE